MNQNSDSTPPDMTIYEASAFWDTYSVADYPSRVVEFEYEPDDNITIVAIAPDIAQPLEQRAKKSGVSAETLVNLWVQEKLSEVS